MSLNLEMTPASIGNVISILDGAFPYILNASSPTAKIIAIPVIFKCNYIFLFPDRIFFAYRRPLYHKNQGPARIHFLPSDRILSSILFAEFTACPPHENSYSNYCQ